MSAGVVLAEEASTTTFQWPDYKNWSVNAKQVMAFEMYNRDWSNQYLKSVNVRIATLTIYLDDPKEPTQLVGEFDILGNGVVFRNINAITSSGVMSLDFQVWDGKEWVSVSPDTFELHLLDSEKFFKEGVLVGVLLSVRRLADPTKPPLELRFLNKEKSTP